MWTATLTLAVIGGQFGKMSLNNVADAFLASVTSATFICESE